MALSSKVIEVADPQWSSSLLRLPHDVYHTAEYCSGEARRLEGEAFAVQVQDGASELFLPLVRRRVWEDSDLYDATSPYGYPGPVFSPDALRDGDFVTQSLLRAADELAAGRICSVFVRTHPLLATPTSLPAGLGSVVTHGETVWIDTSVEERLSWRGVRSSDKNRINKALRSGVVARIDEAWEKLPQFCEIYRLTMDRVDARDDYYFSEEYFRTMKRSLAERAQLCVVEAAGDVIAAGIFFVEGPFVQFHLSGSRTELRHLSPARVMVDFMRRWATERRMKAFHLGGGLGAQQDSLFEFKAGFSPLRATFRTWRMIPSAELFRDACEIAERRLGHPIEQDSAFFPPYRGAAV